MFLEFKLKGSSMMLIRLHVKKHASRTWRGKARNKDKKKV
jgi:hypothetical protein